MLSHAYPRVVRALLVIGGLMLTLSALPAAAQGGDLVYRGSPARVTASVEQWGEDCGVRPKDYTLNERPTVPVARDGEHLVLRFPSGAVRSDRCWSQNPAVRLVSTSANAGHWSTRCETRAGDPKSETGVYEIVSRDETTLELTESSRYDWQLKGSHCIATVRTVRMLERVPQPASQQPDAPLPVADLKAEAASAESEPNPEDGCVAGTLTQLSIFPRRRRVEPGAQACFSVKGSDASGCPIEDPAVRFSVRSLDHGQASMHGACFRSAESAADGEGRFRVVASTGAVSAAALLLVATPDLSDITLQDFGDLEDAGEDATDSTDAPAEANPAPTAKATPEQAPAEAASRAREQGSRAAETRVAALPVEAPPDHRLWWLGLVATAGLLGSLAVAFALRRRRASVAPAADPMIDTLSRPATPPPSVRAAAAPKPAAKPVKKAPAKTEPMICPKCRRGYPPDATRCEGDGTALVTYKAFSSQAAASTQVACRRCGTQLDAQAVFCGNCGTRVST